MKTKIHWQNDTWQSAEIFHDECIELLKNLHIATMGSIPGDLINPSGRFTSLPLRHLQNIVHQIEGAITERNVNEFISEVDELFEFVESLDIELKTLRERAEFIAMALEVDEEELIYQIDTSNKKNNQIIIASVKDAFIELHRNPHLLFKISPRTFEELIAEIFTRNGFIVELTSTTRDGGKDIIAISNTLGIPVKYLIECKRYAPINKVTIDIVQRLYGVRYALNASVGLVVTTSSYTRDALKFASQHPWEISLKDYKDILNWLQISPNTALQRTLLSSRL